MFKIWKDDGKAPEERRWSEIYGDRRWCSERRSGLDRRVMDIEPPFERRSGNERRSGIERRSGRDRRSGEDRRQAAGAEAAAD